LRAGDWTTFCSAVCERRTSGHSLERHGFDVEEDQAVPGHDGVRVAAGARGGARGCIQRSKVSMMRMRPPQQGQGWS